MCNDRFRESHKMKDGIGFVLETLVTIEEKENFMAQLQLYYMKASDVFIVTAALKLHKQRRGID